MTRLLEQAIAEVSKLSAEQQDAIATLILEELADEEQWDAEFAASQDKLAKLAKKAFEESESGKTKRMGLNEL